MLTRYRLARCKPTDYALNPISPANDAILEAALSAVGIRTGRGYLSKVYAGSDADLASTDDAPVCFVVDHTY